MWSRSRKKNRQAGFTGTELLVAIGIIAILTAIAIPGFSNWLPNYYLKAATRDLYSNLQLARLIAAKQNAACAVIFDSGATPGRYFLCSDPGANGSWDGPSAMGGDDVAEKAVMLSEYRGGIDFGGGSATDDIPGSGAPPADPITYATPDDVALFSSTGMVVNFAVSGSYVYLCNSQGSSYGVGTPGVAGAVVMRRWHAGRWE